MAGEKGGQKVDRDALRVELRSLRKGAGLTVQKLAKSPLLLEALATTSPAVARDTLGDLLQSMGSTPQVRALRNAYNLDGGGRSLLIDRRNDFGVAIDRHADTVEVYENGVIDELIERFLDAPSLDDEPVELEIFGVVAYPRLGALRIYIHNAPGPIEIERYGLGARFLLYVLPDFQGRRVNVKAELSFIGERRPNKVFYAVADDNVDAMLGHYKGHTQFLPDRTKMRIENLRPSMVFFATWEDEAEMSPPPPRFVPPVEK